MAPSSPQAQSATFLDYSRTLVSYVEVTRNALMQSLTETDTYMCSTDLTNLMNAHHSIPDVNPNMKVVASTNGTHSKVSNAILRSKELAIHAGSIRDIISIDEIGQFKPSPAVYHHLADRVGKSNALEDIWLVSGNASTSQEL